MKLIYTLLGVIIMLFSFSACSPLNSRTKELDKGTMSEYQVQEQTETKIIQALNSRDRDMLKSVFSKKALSKAVDIDEGINYIFDLYDGNFMEVTDRNHSSQEHLADSKKSKMISTYCTIKTSTDTYILSCAIWANQEFDPSAVGVYTINLDKVNSIDYNNAYCIAGVAFPTHFNVYKIADRIIDGIESENKDIIKETFSKNVINSSDLFETNLNQLISLYGGFYRMDNDDSWISYYEDFCDAFLPIKTTKGKYLLYFRMDLSENRIYRLKLTKIDSEKSVEDYENDFGDKYEFDGIYLDTEE